MSSCETARSALCSAARPLTSGRAVPAVELDAPEEVGGAPLVDLVVELEHGDKKERHHEGLHRAAQALHARGHDALGQRPHTDGEVLVQQRQRQRGREDEAGELSVAATGVGAQEEEHKADRGPREEDAGVAVRVERRHGRAERLHHDALTN
jgi:hypothetical protein